MSKNKDVLTLVEAFSLPPAGRRMVAFTLAEVLITLGIIGVVAAMTLPIFINKYEKKITVERLKETYSIFNQAVSASEVINGDFTYWNYDDSSDNAVYSGAFFDTYLKPYLKGVEKYSTARYIWKKLDGTVDTDGAAMYSAAKYKLPNGVIFTVYAKPYTGNNIHKTSAWILVDINGEKKPNRVGRDVFFMGIYPYLSKKAGKVVMGIHEQCGSGKFHMGFTREELLTTGCASCRKDYSGRGYACGLLIQKGGWEIKDDYPW